jgi:lactate dehydrogenase-like 2-hydroxyacid dehydrogenase
VTLAKNSDVLMIRHAGGPATSKLVNAKVAGCARTDGLRRQLCARLVVDESVLLRYLQEKRNRRRGSRTCSSTGPVVPAEFYTLENVVLYPHVASARSKRGNAMGICR